MIRHHLCDLNILWLQLLTTLWIMSICLITFSNTLQFWGLLFICWVQYITKKQLSLVETLSWFMQKGGTLWFLTNKFYSSLSYCKGSLGIFLIKYFPFTNCVVIVDMNTDETMWHFLNDSDHFTLVSHNFFIAEICYLAWPWFRIFMNHYFEQLSHSLTHTSSYSLDGQLGYFTPLLDAFKYNCYSSKHLYISFSGCVLLFVAFNLPTKPLISLTVNSGSGILCESKRGIDDIQLTCYIFCQMV